jgi:uncharacterized protein DUF4331
MRTIKASFAIFATAAFLFGGLQAGCDEDDTATTAGTGASGATGANGGGGTGGSTGGNGGGGASGFTFDTTEYETYIQVERHGAVEAGTVGIALATGLGPNYPNAFDPDGDADISIRDDYNKSNPEADAAGDWLMEISNSVNTLQSVLNDDLTGLGLTPADLATGLAQAGPVIVPDTIKYDPSKPVAYPNGRALEDQVVDITIAAALLDLSVHPLSLLADLPLNPPANDVPFKTAFPYLADPH